MAKKCILYFPEEYPQWLSMIMGTKYFNFLVKGSKVKRNPRDEGYMRNAAKELLEGNLEFVEAGAVNGTHFADADEIILLWPDAIGYGWRDVEKRIFSVKESKAMVSVLNGRKRHFLFTHTAMSGKYLVYACRRFIERFWLVEMAFSIIFIIVTPFLVVYDFMRGKA